MRSVLVAFAILLAILLAISALGGSLNVTEKFYEDAMEEEAEAFFEETAKEEAENFEDKEETTPETSIPVETTGPTTTGPTTPTAPTAMPEAPETKEEFYAEDGEETIEPFEEDNTYMPY